MACVTVETNSGNIPILHEAFFTFQRKSSIGPSYVWNWPYNECTPSQTCFQTWKLHLDSPGTYTGIPVTGTPSISFSSFNLLLTCGPSIY